MKSSEFINLLNQHYHASVGFACKLSGDRNDALDVVQKASIRAYKNRSDVKDAGSFKSWFFVIVKNTYFNIYTKKTRRRKLLEKAPRDIFSGIHQKVQNLGVRRLALSSILKKISDIKPIYKKPFFMHFKGYSYVEISQKLDVPIGTVKSRIHTAKRKMRARLERRAAA